MDPTLRSEIEALLDQKLKREDPWAKIVPALIAGAIAIATTLLTHWAQGTYDGWQKQPQRNISLRPIALQFEPKIISRDCKFDMGKLRASRFSGYLLLQPGAVAFYQNQWKQFNTSRPAVTDNSSPTAESERAIKEEFKNLSVTEDDVTFFTDVAEKLLLPIYGDLASKETDSTFAAKKWSDTIEKSSLTVNSMRLASLHPTHFEKLRDRQVLSDCSNRKEFEPNKPEFASIGISLVVQLNSEATYWLFPSCRLDLLDPKQNRATVGLPVSVRAALSPSVGTHLPPGPASGAAGGPVFNPIPISSATMLSFVWTPQLEGKGQFDVGEALARILGDPADRNRNVSISMECKLSTGELLTQKASNVPARQDPTAFSGLSTRL